MKTEFYIAEQARAQHALEESERRYENLLATVTDYVYSVTVRDGRPVGTIHGPGCEAVTGYPPRDFQSDQGLWYRMVDEQDRPAVLEQSARIMRGENPPPLEHRIRNKNGQLRWIRNTPIPRRDARGCLNGYEGLISDITQRKENEIALRESRERLELVIRGSNDGIWDWNLFTNEVFFSPRWKSMLGYEDAELANHFSTWENLIHPEDKERCMKQLQAYLRGTVPSYELEHRLRHKDGSYRWILARGVMLRDDEGRPARMAGSHVDLTARKRAEEQLLAAEVRVAKFESVGTLAAGVAHEVRNPLQVILMGVDYLDRNIASPADTVTEVLREMKDAARRANSIVCELLHFSSENDLETVPDDINPLLERSLQLVNYDLIASHVVIERWLSGDLPAVCVNRQKMEQVFVNLFLNALQAMSGGGTLTVRTWKGQAGQGEILSDPAFRRLQPGQPVVIVEVRDNGPGIAAPDLPRVFDPFFTTKPVGAGTGLGLSIVKRFVEIHGGAVTVRNHSEGGVSATVALPALVATQVTQA